MSDDEFLVLELADGTVSVHARDRWGGAISTSYSTCAYFAKARPVLGRQLPDRHARQLAKICPGARR